MKVLVLTQAVDLNDPGLGFFHGWMQEFAKKFDMVSVVCLQEGRHDLPHNVRVYSLGKESGRSRIKYILRFYKYIFALHEEYDAVFVHMNSEYVVLGGLFWRLWGKRVVLWRNHKIKGFSTWVGARLAYVVCYTSPSAYVKRFSNSVRMPIGIDTTTFASLGSAPTRDSILFLGRLDAVKHVDVFLEAIGILAKKGIVPRVNVVGDPTPGREGYATSVKQRFQHLTNVSFQSSVSNLVARGAFQSHAVYVNLTPSGSFDKTIGEAAACGCVIVAANEVLRGVIPDTFLVDPLSSERTAACIEAALKLSSDERAAVSKKLRDYIVREHSLTLLVDKLVPLLQA